MMEYRAFHLQALSYAEARQVVEVTKLLLMDWLEANTACTWWLCSCILKKRNINMMVCSGSLCNSEPAWALGFT